MNRNLQLACAWYGIAFVTLVTLGWIVIAGLVPLPPPSLGGEEIAQFFQQNTGRIRFGALVSLFAMALSAPRIAVLSLQLKRIEGDTPIMTYTQLVASALIVVALVKVRFVVRYFMEVRLAAPVLKWLTDGWVAIVCAALLVLYWLGA